MPAKWDIRFLQLSRLVSAWSKDPSTKTGAVIVRADRSVLSVGFNGFPKNMPDEPQWYADREEKYSRMVHCEVNAQLHAYEPLKGCTLYTWPFSSCDRCCVTMLQAGITRFVWPSPSADVLSRWADAIERTKRYILEAGLTFTEIPIEEVLQDVA